MNSWTQGSVLPFVDRGPKRPAPASAARLASFACLRLLLVVSACGGSQHPTQAVVEDSDLGWEVESKLREAELKIGEGDRDGARELLTECSELLAEPELASSPDRHQLEFTRRELETRLSSGSSMVAVRSTPTVPVKSKPVRAAVASSASSDSKPALAMVEKASTDEDEEAADLFTLEEKSNPEEAFREGPLANHKKGIKLLRRAKRVRSKGKRVKFLREAREHLDSCGSEGSAMLDEHPKLKRVRFSVGKKRLRAAKITRRCKSKARWVKRKLARKTRHS